MILQLALVVAAALIAFGVGGAVLRRSLPGLVASGLTGLAGGVLLAVALLGRTGSSVSLGHVIAMAGIVAGTGGFVSAIAVYVAAARASRRVDRLEPW